MKKEEWIKILKKCFGKEKDERWHAGAMLIIYGIFITFVIVSVRTAPSTTNQQGTNQTTTPTNTPVSTPNSNTSITDGIIKEETQETIPSQEYEINYSYVFTIQNNEYKEVITGKKLDDKEIFTIIDTTGSTDYAKLSDNYLKKENGEYHIVESPSNNLKYVNVEDIIELTLNTTPTQTENIYTYTVPSYQVMKMFHPDRSIDSIDGTLMDTIILTTENDNLKKIDINFSNYYTALSIYPSTLIITMEFSNIGTTEDFNITVN